MDDLTLLLAGDVMTGRGIDQVLPYPCDPVLYEPYVRSALDYVDLAEAASGPIPQPADFAYIWGDALAEIERRAPAVRLINLETAVTRSDRAVPKGINYRMSPENLPALAAAGIDCCTLANNHVLDWSEAGLLETLDTLSAAGLRTAGAGRDVTEARAPAMIPAAGGGRILVFAYGMPSSGIPADWAAEPQRPGVNFLPRLDPAAVRQVYLQVAAYKRPGDVVVLSVHWGGNWGYEVPDEHRYFARAVVDEAGVDLVHGHSSHHVKAFEIYRDRLILYGCGDLLNDYEGIHGHESFRADLGVLYFPVLDRWQGTLKRLEMVPMQTRNFRLGHAAACDGEWLRDMLNREGARFGIHAAVRPDRCLQLA